MQRFFKDIIGLRVVDLQTERPVGRISDLVLNPHNLSIGALVCYVKALDDDRFILPEDIHKVFTSRILIQSADQLAELDDLVKVQEFMEINYQLEGKKVRTQTKTKVGVVSDFVIDDQELTVSKLYVRPPITKLLNNSDRIIGRNQIIEINDREIIVRDTSIKAKRFARANATD